MKFFTSKRGLLLVLASFVLLISGAWAQTGTTSLHGKVVDSSHATVPGAKVTLANQTRGFLRTVTTPSSGEFQFVALPPGTYVLSVEKDGFKRSEQRDVPASG